METLNTPPAGSRVGRFLRNRRARRPTFAARSASAPCLRTDPQSRRGRCFPTSLTGRWKFAPPCLAALLFLLLARGALLAQVPPELVVMADHTPIVIKAPRPFVEVSSILSDAFAQRAHALAAANGNRLLAWFIPALSLGSQLDAKPNEKSPRSRALQVEVSKDLEPVLYDGKSFDDLRAGNTRGFAVISEDNTDMLFNTLNLARFESSGGQKILGTADLGTDSFTLCVGISTEGSDQLGGRDVETSVTCVTYALIKEKVILLTVTGPELSSKELRNCMRLTREWVALLRDSNSEKPETPAISRLVQ